MLIPIVLLAAVVEIDSPNDLGNSFNQFSDSLYNEQNNTEKAAKTQEAEKTATKTNVEENLLSIFFTLIFLILLTIAAVQIYKSRKVKQAPQDKKTAQDRKAHITKIQEENRLLMEKQQARLKEEFAARQRLKEEAIRIAIEAQQNRKKEEERLKKEQLEEIKKAKLEKERLEQIKTEKEEAENMERFKQYLKEQDDFFQQCRGKKDFTEEEKSKMRCFYNQNYFYIVLYNFYYQLFCKKHAGFFYNTYIENGGASFFKKFQKNAEFQFLEKTYKLVSKFEQKFAGKFLRNNIVSEIENASNKEFPLLNSFFEIVQKQDENKYSLEMQFLLKYFVFSFYRRELSNLHSIKEFFSKPIQGCLLSSALIFNHFFPKQLKELEKCYEALQNNVITEESEVDYTDYVPGLAISELEISEL